VAPLPETAFDGRLERVVAMLRADGDLEIRSTPSGTGPAVFDIRVKAPGGAAGHDMSFRYMERFRPDAGAWVLEQYAYLMASQSGLGQREYHLHRLPGSTGPVLHAHCLGIGVGERAHFRSHRVLLEEARDEFLRRYASGAAVDCRDLYPLLSRKV
jgi:hypothetical protein